MKQLFLAASLALFSFCVAADSGTRLAKVEKILIAQQMNELLNIQQAQFKEEAYENLVRNIFNKVLMENLPAGVLPKSAQDDLFARFIRKNQTALDTNKILHDAAVTYSEGMTDAELDVIAHYYQSSEGKKDVASAKRTSLFLGKVIAQNVEQTMNSAVDELVAALEKYKTKK